MTPVEITTRLPSSDCAAERDLPSPVLMSATPAIASGARSKSPSTSANEVSGKGSGASGVIDLLRESACVRAPQPPGPSPLRRVRTEQKPPAAPKRETGELLRWRERNRLASPAIRRISCPFLSGHPGNSPVDRGWPSDESPQQKNEWIAEVNRLKRFYEF